MRIFLTIIILAFFLTPFTVKSQVIDNFSDSELNTNPTWYGELSKFEISNPQTTGDGSLNASANADFYVLSSKQNTGDAIITTQSTQAYGEWRFNLADGKDWSVSSTNDYKIIIISDDSTTANLKDGNHNFNGYFFQHDGGFSDQFVLYKQTGNTTDTVVKTYFPTSIDGATPIGRTIKITREPNGDWQIFFDEGFDVEPTTLLGSGNDNTHTTSAYFGIATNISSPGTVRILYFDNLYIGAIITDTIPPTVDNISIISQNQLNVQFSETIDTIQAQMVSNYIVNNGIGNPQTAIINATDNALVHLNFANGFVNETSYEIITSNIFDNDTNTMAIDTSYFTYFVIEENFIVINEIMADPSPIVQLPEYEYVEIHNTTAYDLSLLDWTLTVGTSTATIPDITIPANGYYILCGTSAESHFLIYGNVKGVPNFPTLTNAGQTILLKDSANNLINSVAYTEDWYQDNTKDDGGWSLERIDAQNNCSGITNWRASNDFIGGTPGYINSIDGNNIDNSAPIITNVILDSENTLSVYFNEFVDTASAKNIANYVIDNGIGTPIYISCNINDSISTLTFSSNFNETQTYSLSISNIADYCGNILASTDKDFVFYRAKTYDVQITEIMADPNPAIGLPEYEYLEIYNKSGFDIDIKNWTLLVNTSDYTIPDYKLQANSYAVLCSEEIAQTFTADFSANVISFSSFPTLVNSGSIISIINNLGNIISTVSYSDNWYQSDYKQEGGWSLEQIDYENPCGESENWIASDADDGGTPGKINSVYESNLDVESPSLTRAAIIDSSSLRIYFTEALDSSTIYNLSTYSVDNGIGSPVFADAVEPDFKSIKLNFASSFSKNIIYTITLIDSITDCAGNYLDISYTVEFALPDTILPNEILINEVLFDPLGDGVDFVEIYNNSSKTFDLKDLKLATIDTDSGTITSVKNISEDGFLLMPQKYLVLSTNQEIVKQQYHTKNTRGFVDMESLPTFSNDEGIVVLTDYKLTKIDEFEYNEDMHFSLLNSYDGVSLERLSFTRNTNDKTNWHSAAEGVGFATPAYKNSQYNEENFSDNEITIEPETFSPDNDGYEDIVNINYKFEKPGYTASIIIFDAKGRTIKRIANNELLGITGTFSWDGIADNKQKAIVGIYLIYFEIFDLEGNIKRYKRTCVLASKH